MGINIKTIFDLVHEDKIEDENDEILKAKELLVKNGYVVKKA